MRILSQDGMCDYPYDEVGLSIGYKGDKSEFYIFFHHKLQDEGFKIAVYSTAEKAQKAMEMLREAYQKRKWEPTVIEDGEITEMQEWHYSEYFRFPSDEEI